MKNSRLPPIFSLTSMAHSIIAQCELESQIVIDATCGNGHDTAFLAAKVGNQGHVFAYDIQAEACASTMSNLEKLGLQDRVTLIHDSHTTMTQTIPLEYHGNIAAIMFNLGYLPTAEKSRITTPDTTYAALEQSTILLQLGGMISLAVYCEHSGGIEELRRIEDFLSSLPSSDFRIAHLCYPFRKKKAPELYIIHKMS